MAEWWEELIKPAVPMTPAGIGSLIGVGVSQNPDIIRSILGGGAQASPNTGTVPPTGPTMAEAGIKEPETDKEKADREMGESVKGQVAAAARKANAEATKAEAEAARLQRELDDMDDKESIAYQAKAAQLAQAQAQTRLANAQIARLVGSLTEEQQIRLTDELATKREEARQKYETGRDVIREEGAERRLDRSERGATERLGISEAGQNTRAGLAAGVNIWDSMNRRDESRQRSEVDMRGQDMTFIVQMLKNQIDAGTLSLNKASKIFEAAVTKAKLPSEIMRNVGAAVEPFAPYLTNKKAGDIPEGFEKGGPMATLQMLGGGSYDPKAYAVNPQAIGIGPKDFKPDLSKIPDPKKAFAGVPDIVVNPNQPPPPRPALLGPVDTSRLGGLVQQMTPSTSMAQTAPTDAERKAIEQGVTR